MKITLLVVGKTTDVHIETLIQEYQKRLTHYIPFALQVIPELKNTKALTPEQQKQAEGELILRTITTATDLILLDEHGKEFRSIEFSDYLQKKGMVTSRVSAASLSTSAFSARTADCASMADSRAARTSLAI